MEMTFVLRPSLLLTLVFFSAHVELFPDAGDDSPLTVDNFQRALRFEFPVDRGLLADFSQLFFMPFKHSGQRATPGSNEVDASSLVPHDIVVAKQGNQHQCIGWVAHAVEAATEVGAEGVAVIKAPLDLHDDPAEIIADFRNGNP